MDNTEFFEDLKKSIRGEVSFMSETEVAEAKEEEARDEEGLEEDVIAIAKKAKEKNEK